MRADIHIHSDFSDGTATVDQIAEQATRLDMDLIAIVDHVRSSTDWLQDFVEAVESARGKFGGEELTILCGVEAKCLDFNGTLDLPEGAAELVDFVVGAMHRIPSDDGFLVSAELNQDIDVAIENWERSVSAFLKNPNMDVWAHPGTILYISGIEIPAVICQRISAIARKNNKFVERSTRHSAPRGDLLRSLERAGIDLLPGSDSHSLEDMRQYSGSLEVSKSAMNRFFLAIGHDLDSR